MKNVFLCTKLAAIMALALPIAAQEPGITRNQAEQIINELRQIRTLLQSEGKTSDRAQPQKARLDLRDASPLGSKNAPLTLVQFTDYQCPFCQKFHMSTFAELKRNYIDTGKLRFYSRDLPLSQLHSDALRAAQAGRCAGEQGRFWEISDMMGSNPQQLLTTNLIAYATDLKLDVNAFRVCLEGEKYKDAIAKDVTEAEKLGVRGTPTFVLGRSTPEGVDGELLRGTVAYAVLDQKLQQLAVAK